MPPALENMILVFSAGLGVCVGSFLNVCIYRMPREKLSVGQPRRSFCPSCGNAIRWSDNVPIISWILLGGRCRFCHSAISIRYLLVEALTGLLFVLVAVRYLLRAEPSLGAYVAVLALVTALVVASFIDWDLRILPDEITIGGMIMAPFVMLAVPELHTWPTDGSISWCLLALREPFESVAATLPLFLRQGAGLMLTVALASILAFGLGLWLYGLYWRLTRKGERRPVRARLLAGVLACVSTAAGVACLLKPEWIVSPRIYSLSASLAGMAAGAGFVLLVGEVGSRVFRKPAMGFGDVKLMGLLGAFTGWFGVLVGFFIACVLGSIFGIFLLLRHRSRYLPFGPFLALGALSMLLWPEALESLMDWYMGLF